MIITKWYDFSRRHGYLLRVSSIVRFENFWELRRRDTLLDTSILVPKTGSDEAVELPVKIKHE